MRGHGRGHLTLPCLGWEVREDFLGKATLLPKPLRVIERNQENNTQYMYKVYNKVLYIH
jgi:hypothetical protein